MPLLDRAPIPEGRQKVLEMDEFYARATDGLFEAWRRAARAAPDGESWDVPGLVVASMGLPWASLNRGIIAGPQNDARAAVGTVVDFFRSRSLPFVLQVREELPREYADAAVDAGLAEVWRAPMMVLVPIDAAALRAGADGCEIREARTPEELSWAGDVAVRGFGAEHVRAFATPALAREGMRYFTGFVDGRPVATSMVFSHEGTAGIYFVSTDPEYRRRGLGEALTAAAIRCGADQGCDMAYLEASDMGYPVYERMGFRTLGRTIGFRAAEMDAG